MPFTWEVLAMLTFSAVATYLSFTQCPVLDSEESSGVAEFGPPC